MYTAVAEPSAWNLPLTRYVFPFPAELTLAFKVQNSFLEVAKEVLYSIAKELARFRDIVYPPSWELSILDVDAYCIRFAEYG